MNCYQLPSTRSFLDLAEYETGAKCADLCREHGMSEGTRLVFVTGDEIPELCPSGLNAKIQRPGIG